MKSFVFILFLFLAILACVIGNCFYIRHVCAEMRARMDAIPTPLDERCIPLTQELLSYWEGQANFVSLSVGFLQVDRVTEEAKKLLSCAQTGDISNFYTSLALLRDAVEDVGRLERVSVGNLLSDHSPHSHGSSVWPYTKIPCFLFTKRAGGVITDGAPISQYRNFLVALYDAGTARSTFDVLVENMGRINNCQDMLFERKGMRGLMYGDARLSGCTVRTLPLDDLSGLNWKENDSLTFSKHAPIFWRGSFSAQAGVDTYVDVRGFGHGAVYLNGVNLGRYDKAGPQYTLYVPGGFVKEENEFIILDFDPSVFHDEISVLDHSILEGEGEELT